MFTFKHTNTKTFTTDKQMQPLWGDVYYKE